MGDGSGVGLGSGSERVELLEGCIALKRNSSRFSADALASGVGNFSLGANSSCFVGEDVEAASIFTGVFTGLKKCVWATGCGCATSEGAGLSVVVGDFTSAGFVVIAED